MEYLQSFISVFYENLNLTILGYKIGFIFSHPEKATFLIYIEFRYRDKKKTDSYEPVKLKVHSVYYLSTFDIKSDLNER